MNKLIGISGHAGSGKDLLADLIQYRSWINKYYNGSDEILSLDDFNIRIGIDYIYETKKFAGILKDITCMLIGCTRKQLEDRDFKEKPLGEEWTKYKVVSLYGDRKLALENQYFNTKEEAKKYEQGRLDYEETGGYDTSVIREQLTPRLLLQLLGTEAGREIIHPQIWVNALFSTYNKNKNWIITDVRFPNEAEVIKKKGGKLIRIERPSLKPSKFVHSSETALDHYNDWDLVIQNDGTIVELFNKISKFI